MYNTFRVPASIHEASSSLSALVFHVMRYINVRYLLTYLYLLNLLDEI